MSVDQISFTASPQYQRFFRVYQQNYDGISVIQSVDTPRMKNLHASFSASANQALAERAKYPIYLRIFAFVSVALLVLGIVLAIVLPPGKIVGALFPLGALCWLVVSVIARRRAAAEH